MAKGFEVKSYCKNCRRRYWTNKMKNPNAPKCKYCGSTRTVSKEARMVE